jgi:hypothetical protein
MKNVGFGKLSTQMFSDIKQIKMFQIAKTSVMKTNHDGNNPGIGHAK